MVQEDALRDWWCGLTEEQRQHLLEADGKPARVSQQVMAESTDGGLSEVSIPVGGIWHLPQRLRDEPCP